MNYDRVTVVLNLMKRFKYECLDRHNKSGGLIASFIFIKLDPRKFEKFLKELEEDHKYTNDEVRYIMKDIFSFKYKEFTKLTLSRVVSYVSVEVVLEDENARDVELIKNYTVYVSK